MIEYKDVAEWLGDDHLDVNELLGLIADIANGLYDPKDLAREIKEYKEHNDK